MGTQNAALAGVTLGVCVETRSMNTNTTEVLHLKARGLMLLWGKGWPHPCNLGDTGGPPWEAFDLPQRGCGLASHTDISMAGSADVVPSGWSCGIHLYWVCPLEMLWEHKDGQRLISLVGEMKVRCLNWQKCLVYIRKCGVRQMRKFISPFNIHLKCLAPGRLKAFPRSQSGLNASRCKTHDLARVEEGRFGGHTSSFPAN